MKYITQDIRRQDRLLSEEEAFALLRAAEYGVLSMLDNEGGTYSLPINYVWNGKTSLYFHCAPEGRKLQLLEVHPQVSFCIVGNVELAPSKFTTYYSSILLKGTAHLHLPEEERRMALKLLVEDLSPNDCEVGEKYIEKSFHRVDVVRIDIEQWAGKTKREGAPLPYLNDK